MFDVRRTVLSFDAGAAGAVVLARGELAHAVDFDGPDDLEGERIGLGIARHECDRAKARPSAGLHAVFAVQRNVAGAELSLVVPDRDCDSAPLIARDIGADLELDLRGLEAGREGDREAPECHDRADPRPEIHWPEDRTPA